jgi:hypothetical protein
MAVAVGQHGSCFYECCGVLADDEMNGNSF